MFWGAGKVRVTLFTPLMVEPPEFTDSTHT
jgi:hypothetical protein